MFGTCRKGDYQRYLAEFTHEAERKESAEGALVAYKAATELASADLPATNPVRLGLALNFSVRQSARDANPFPSPSRVFVPTPIYSALRLLVPRLRLLRLIDSSCGSPCRQSGRRPCAAILIEC